FWNARWHWPKKTASVPTTCACRSTPRVRPAAQLPPILERALALAEEDRIGADDLRLPQHAPRAPGGAA
ncbi:hypothetical protein C7E24_22155, partial [Stenotrophomonas maltophilia]